MIHRKYTPGKLPGPGLALDVIVANTFFGRAKDASSPTPAYSTYLMHAFFLVEEITRNGRWGFNLHFYPTATKGKAFIGYAGRYEAELWKLNKPPYEAIADTAPHAIVLAALASKGIK